MRISFLVLNAVSKQRSQPQLTQVGGEPGRYSVAPQTAIPPAGQSTPVPPANAPAADGRSANARPADVEALIAALQQQFPHARVRITGRGRTVRRQAELMAQRRRLNRTQFLQTYLPAPHITEMDNWVTAHPGATEAEIANAFVAIINRARARGARVSNHLADQARDISIPQGGRRVEQEVHRWLTDMGARVLDERDATGGAHWHVDY